MVEFKKERNFIVGYEDGTIAGKWDIITGQFIGKSGKVLVGCPACFKYDNLPDYRTNGTAIFGSAVRFYRELVLYYHCHYSRTRGERFEQLISVGLLPRDFDDLEDDIRLTKELVQDIKERNNGIYSHKLAIRYNTERQHKALLQDKPNWYKEAFMLSGERISYDFKKSFLDRCLLEKVNYNWTDYNDYGASRGIINLMQNYYNKCMEMYGEVKVNHNILTANAHINALYEEYRTAHYDDNLKKNNDKSFLKFTFGEYEAFPLLTRQQFHEEGTNNNNCVERLYMEKVVDGNTYITVIRRIDNPEKSLVTCEVMLNGFIRQYLKFSNQQITEPDLLQFKEEYQKYILKNMSHE